MLEIVSSYLVPHFGKITCIIDYLLELSLSSLEFMNEERTFNYEINPIRASANHC